MTPSLGEVNCKTFFFGDITRIPFFGNARSIQMLIKLSFTIHNKAYHLVGGGRFVRAGKACAAACAAACAPAYGRGGGGGGGGN